MIPVTFGSVYKVFITTSDLKRKDNGIDVLQEYCKGKDFFTRNEVKEQPKPARIFGKDELIHEIKFISCPKEYDHDIDMICTNHKIKHIKKTPEREYLRTWIPSKPQNPAVEFLKRLFS